MVKIRDYAELSKDADLLDALYIRMLKSRRLLRHVKSLEEYAFVARFINRETNKYRDLKESIKEKYHFRDLSLKKD